ncbi:hypothetical protein QYE76_038380 [Lolium multiflorum]|uniref:Core-2/I-branching beta-1,6-N-acetylglucosaminyltransferase family protein n=1 Tax=Lolium multiflorum TaxID=4521 RepID=A0AAD8T8S0_LOLMU|nr:hypothetical protein QYE76_038380 [Lolium multiflorum]
MPPGGAVVVGSSNGKDCSYATARSFPVKLSRPLLFFAVLATGFLVAPSLLFLGGGRAASSYYGLPSLPGPGVLLAAVRSAPCAEEKEVYRWWARPPSKSAWHNMSDEELLWAASFEPRTAPPPRPSTPRKVAFLFLTRGPLPLAPLWERFFDGTGGTAGSGRKLFSVYVHTTPGYRLDFPPSSPFHRRQIPSKATEWGMPSVVDAERRLLANALLDLDNERFVLVSESCIPLHPLATVHAYLTRSAHSFVTVVDDPGRDGLGRYPDGLAPEVPVSRWRKGTQWFELHRSLAVFVAADGRYYPRFREECLPRCYVDEHYLPTVLTMEEPGSLANRSVTWVDWSRGGAHPARFGARDVGEEFLERLAGKKEKERCMYNGQPVEVCFLFARKFAPGALQKLLQLSPRILGY